MSIALLIVMVGANCFVCGAVFGRFLPRARARLSRNADPQEADTVKCFYYDVSAER